MVDALTLRGDEGRGVTAISVGEVSSNLWPGDFRMRKLNQANLDYLHLFLRFEIFPPFIKGDWGGFLRKYKNPPQPSFGKGGSNANIKKKPAGGLERNLKRLFFYVESCLRGWLLQAKTSIIMKWTTKPKDVSGKIINRFFSFGVSGINTNWYPVEFSYNSAFIELIAPLI